MQPFEIMISESQERMAAVVEPARLAEVQAVCARHELPCTVIGTIIEGDRLVAQFAGETVGDLPVAALADAPTYALAPQRPDSLADQPLALDCDRRARRRLGAARAAARAAERLLEGLGLRAVRPARRLGHRRAPRRRRRGRAAHAVGARDRRVARRRRRARRARPAPRRPRGRRAGGAQRRLQRCRAGRDHELPELRQPRAPGDGVRAARGDLGHVRGLPRPSRRRSSRATSRSTTSTPARRSTRRPSSARWACSSAPGSRCRRTRAMPARSLLLLGAAAPAHDGSERQALEDGRASGRIPEPALAELAALCRALGEAARERAARLRPRRVRWRPGGRDQRALPGGRRRLRPRAPGARRARRRHALRRGLRQRPRDLRFRRPRASGSPRSASDTPCRSSSSAASAASGSSSAPAPARSTSRSARPARPTRTRFRSRWSRADVRRLRHLRARSRRLAAHVLRHVRAPAPRPGERGHRRLRRPPRDRAARDGPRLAGLRRVEAEGARRRLRDRPHALLDDRLGDLAELAADRPPSARDAPSPSATTATSRTPPSCATSSSRAACTSTRRRTPR